MIRESIKETVENKEFVIPVKKYEKTKQIYIANATSVNSFTIQF